MCLWVIKKKSFCLILFGVFGVVFIVVFGGVFFLYGGFFLLLLLLLLLLCSRPVVLPSNKTQI